MRGAVTENRIYYWIDMYIHTYVCTYRRYSFKTCVRNLFIAFRPIHLINFLAGQNDRPRYGISQMVSQSKEKNRTYNYTHQGII